MRLELYRFGFIIEQALGHVAYGQNLKEFVTTDQSVKAHWALPSPKAHKLTHFFMPNWTLRAGWQVRQAIGEMHREVSLDALLFHTQVTAVLATNWIRQIPSIISLDATPQQYDELGEFYAHAPGPEWLENWKWKLNCNAFRVAQHIVAWSDWTKEGISRNYEIPESKITVIPPGVNVQEWRHPQPRNFMSTGPVKILFVGGNLERKGGLILLEAFRSLRIILAEREPNLEIELHLVTKDHVVEEPCLFVYNNFQPNSAPLKQLYHDCDIFCLPTFGDFLPMVLSEAAAAGLPTISTNVAAIPEITLDGKTGFIIPPGDVSSLVQALLKLVTDADLRRQQGIQAIEYVQQKYDAQVNANRLLDLLKSVADRFQSSEQ